MSDPNIIKLRKKTYLKMIENSIGTKLFNSAFVKFKDTGKVTDILNNGEFSCAFFVSGVLTLCKYLDSPHATIKRLKEELIKAGWKKVNKSNLQPGDVVFWERMVFPDGTENEHIGFVLNKNQAISTDYKSRKVTKHHITFNNKRKIIEVFRLPANS